MSNAIYVAAETVKEGDVLVTGAVRRPILRVIEMPRGFVFVTNSSRTHTMAPNDAVAIIPAHA